MFLQVTMFNTRKLLCLNAQVVLVQLLGTLKSTINSWETRELLLKIYFNIDTTIILAVVKRLELFETGVYVYFFLRGLL